jgi:hypothetical protein
MDDIAETGRLYVEESQIKIVRVEPVEQPAPEAVHVKGPSDLDEPEGVLQAPGVERAPEENVEPAWNEMKAGYRYAAGHWRRNR